MNMIKICEDYACEHDILFNGKKSKYLIFGKDGKYKYNHTVKVNNEIVERCEEADHLGHPLHTTNTLNALAEKGLNNLNASFMPLWPDLKAVMQLQETSSFINIVPLCMDHKYGYLIVIV